MNNAVYPFGYIVFLLKKPLMKGWPKDHPNSHQVFYGLFFSGTISVILEYWFQQFIPVTLANLLLPVQWICLANVATASWFTASTGMEHSTIMPTWANRGGWIDFHCCSCSLHRATLNNLAFCWESEGMAEF